MIDLTNKVVLITGASSGFGEDAAKLFAKEGCRVVLAARRLDRLQALAAEIQNAGGEALAIPVDVSQPAEIEVMVQSTLDLYGRIDILFNNAGILHVATTHETPTEIWDKTFAINVRGTYLMSKYTIPHMLEQGKGCIVNNSSVLGLKAVPAVAAYNATKGAITQLTRSMALEYSDKGIRVNAICPGTIVTPLVEGLFDQTEDRKATEDLFKSFHPIGRLGTPEEIAHAVLFLCDDNVGFMTGSMLSVDGGWIAR